MNTYRRLKWLLIIPCLQRLQFVTFVHHRINVSEMVSTRVLSIRINKKTLEHLEKNAKILNLKISVLAAKVLEEKTEEWSKEYATRIYHELGLNKEKFLGDE